MPRFEPLSDKVLDAIAEKVGKRLFTVLPATLGGGQDVRLHETVDVWMLEGGALLEPTDDLTKLAKSTGRWHHQIKVGGHPLGYAETTPLGAEPKTWSVVGISESTLAQRIDETIDWIDQNIVDDSVVRLLVIPAYQIHAFWLLSENTQSIVVINAPDEYQGIIQPKHVYSTKEFREALRSVRHIQGLIF